MSDSPYHFFHLNSRKKSLDLLRRWIERGESFSTFLQLDKEYEKKLYTNGYNSFINNDVKKAAQLFSLLTLLNCNQKEYWKALGACQYNLKQYQEAIATYTVSNLLDCKDFQTIIYIALCYENLNEKKKALNTLQWAMSLEIDDDQKRTVMEIQQRVRS